MLKDVFGIDKYYVGRLYFSYLFDNLLEESIGHGNVQNLEKTQMYESIYKLCNNGAVAPKWLPSQCFTRVNFYSRRMYEGVLTLFYKNGEDCLCLHDGNVYSSDGNNYYTDMVPLKSFLPKVDYDIPEEITTKEAIRLFESLFKENRKNTIIDLYKNNKYDIGEFSVGKLILYNSYSLDRSKSDEYKCFNIPTKIILMKNSAINYGGFIVNSIDNGDESKKYNHSFSEYNCLYLLQNKELYNINAHNYYENTLYSGKKITDLDVDKSYCEVDIPLNEYLENRGVSSPRHQDISIEKALKLFKKTK